MRNKWLWFAAVLLVAAGYWFYRSRPSDHLNVAPDARRVIEKAKRR